jgi:hypothetical protein
MEMLVIEEKDSRNAINCPEKKDSAQFGKYELT